MNERERERERERTIAVIIECQELIMTILEYLQQNNKKKNDNNYNTIPFIRTRKKLPPKKLNNKQLTQTRHRKTTQL